MKPRLQHLLIGVKFIPPIYLKYQHQLRLFRYGSDYAILLYSFTAPDDLSKVLYKICIGS